MQLVANVTVLAALYVMAQSGMSLKGIREVQVPASKSEDKECLIHEPTDEELKNTQAKSANAPAAEDPSRA